MENGRIVEQGSHNQLLGRGGAYAELYNSQFVAPAAEVD
jgi:ATP-binding cassette subfamily B protein